MKTFGEFQEAAAAVKALPTIVKAFTKVAPMVAPKLQTFAKFSTAIPVGLTAAGTILQARKKGKFQRKEMKGRVGDNQKIKPKLLDAIRKKQREMLGKTDDKLNTPTDLPNFDGKKIDAKTRSRMNAPENQFNSYNPLHEERYKRSPKLKKYDDFLDDARNASTPEKKLNYVRKATKEHNQVKKSSPKDIQ